MASRMNYSARDKGSCLPGELQAELDFDVFWSVCEVAKFAPHGDGNRLDGFKRRLEAISSSFPSDGLRSAPCHAARCVSEIGWADNRDMMQDISAFPGVKKTREAAAVCWRSKASTTRAGGC